MAIFEILSKLDKKIRLTEKFGVELKEVAIPLHKQKWPHLYASQITTNKESPINTFIIVSFSSFN